MLGLLAVSEPARSWLERRRQASQAEILRAAWEIVGREGVAALTLRELAAAIGMKAPSLYSHFPSKLAIYDALFADGYREFLQLLPPLEPPPADPEADLRQFCHEFMRFCLAGPARYQLLFQRPVPDFEPGPESMRLVTGLGEYLERAAGVLGFRHPAAMDILTALTSGLANQQLANDPGGDRWVRLVDDAVDMFLDYVKR